MTRESLVGLMFTVAVALFALFAYLSGGLMGLGETTHTISTTFPNVTGLEVDDRVTLVGKEIGKVTRIAVEGDHVRVDMKIIAAEPVRVDAIARLQSESMLGGRELEISLGSADAPLVQAGGSIEGRAGVGFDELVESVGAMSTDVQVLAQSLQANQQDFFNRLGEVVDEAKTTFSTVNRILVENEEGLSEAMGSLAEVGPKLESIFTRLDEITKQVQSGEGTLGKLVYDPTLYDEMTQLAKSLNASADRLSTIFGEDGGDIGGALEAFTNAAPQFEETMQRINSVAAKIDEGRGTLGKLVNDDQLYVEATRAMKAVGDAAEAAREQGPISTFTGAVVGAAAAFN